MSILLLFVCTALIGFVYSLLLSRIAKKQISCKRCFSRQQAFAGQEIEMIEIVRNESLLPVPWLRLESRFSPWLCFHQNKDVDIHGDMYHCSLFTLMPRQQITRRHRIKLLRRGIYDIGNATLTVGDPLGFSQAVSEINGTARLIVYPSLPDADKLPILLSKLTGEHSVPYQLLRDPYLVCALRPYVPGDPVRDIHWSATARTGTVHVKLHDPTSALRLMVILNCQLREDQWNDISDYEEPAIEQLLSIAAGMCREAMKQGLPAGFCSNLRSPFSENEPVLLPAASGTAAIEKLLFTTAALKIRKAEQFNHYLERFPHILPIENLDLVILSCYDSPALQSYISGFRKAGVSVSLHVIPWNKGGAAA